MKSFKTTFLALIATAFVFAGCGAFSQTPQEKEETSNLVTNAIENGDIFSFLDRKKLKQTDFSFLLPYMIDPGPVFPEQGSVYTHKYSVSRGDIE